ncbi:MAG: amino acid adenylation domain-containing protein [Pseudomonadota bacterium]
MIVEGNKNSIRSCFIIGEGSLTLNCAEWILLQGCQIHGIVSSSKTIKKWANENDIPYFDSKNKQLYETAILNDNFDYLFSIVNPAILKEPLLSKPHIFSINFHDSFLPRYAGMHSTSWAIINGEQEHGITWHIMLEKVDAGDILKQAKVTLEPDDTAISLNQKCYETAFSTFKELLSELLTDTYIRQPQQVDPNTYCGLYSKPRGNGWIRWDQTAEKIEALYRAAQLGKHNNFFSTCKFVYKGAAYIVEELTSISCNEINSPGTVVLCDKKELQVATKTKTISIKRLKNLDGTPCKFLEMYKNLGIKAGKALHIPDYNNWEAFQEKSIELAKHEQFWLRQWRCFKPASLPRLEIRTLSNLEDIPENITEFNLGEKFRVPLNNLFPEINNSDILLALCLLYLYRFGNKEMLGVALNTPVTRKHSSLQRSLISDAAPLTLVLEDEMDFRVVLEKIFKEKLIFERNKTFLQDLHGRYPELLTVEKPIISITLDLSPAEDPTLSERNRLNQYPINIYIKEGRILFSIKKIASNSQLDEVFKYIPGHLETLLEGIIKNSDQSIALLPLLPPPLFKKIVYEINNTDEYYPEETIYQLFEEQAEKKPYNSCIFYEEEKINFINANEKSNQLAHFLLEKKIKQESRIAVFMQRGIDRVIAQLAIGKSGCSFVVIDVEYPEERIAEILKDSQASCALTHKNYSSKLKGKANYFELDKLEEDLMLQPKGNLNITVSPDSAIYFLPTSGTTGKSKLVKVLHKGVVNLVFSLAKKLKVTANDTVLNFSESTFDVAYWEIFAALISGAKLRIPTQDERSPGPILADTLRKYGITIAGFPPSVLKLTPSVNLPALRYVIAAGEACTEEVLILWRKYHLLNAYGPTETTIFTVAADHPPESYHSHADIGLPLANVKVYILDENLQLVGIGQEGQLYIGGVCLGGGYENKKQLTDEKFIPNPFISGERIYATGDLVRFLVNERKELSIEYLDRIDTMVKVNGLRINLAGIEAILEKHPRVKEAAVAIKQVGVNGHKQLVAYVIQSKELQLIDEPLTTEGLQCYLSRILPHYEIPVIFYDLDDLQFPRTRHDKLDRNTLIKGSYTTLPLTATKQTPPENSEQILLVALWRQILHREQIGIHDSFVALGGDSILAMQVSAELQQRGYYLSIKNFFKTPTIAELATKLEKITFHEAVEESMTSFPLTPIQHWFFNKKLKMPNQFSQVCLLEVRPDTNIDRLVKILKSWSTVYSTFSLRFKQTPSGWEQSYVREELDNKTVIEVQKTSWANKADFEKIMDDWSVRLQSNFNIETGPIIGAVILQNLEVTDSTSHYLLIAVHHLVVDGVSWRICLQDLETAYKLENFSLANLSLSAHASPFSKWSSTLQKYKKIQDDEPSYFGKKDMHNPFSLICDHIRGENIEKYSDNITQSLNKELTVELLKNEIRPRELLMAVLIKTIVSWTGNKECVLDIETHGREASIDPTLKLESAIGWFTSLFPISFNLSGCTSLNEIVKLVKDQFESIPNNGLDYGVQRYLSLNEKKLINASQICFNYWGQFDQLFSEDSPFQFKGLDLVSHPENERTHLMVIEAAVIKNRLHVTCNYSKNHFLQQTMKRVLEDYFKILESYLSKAKKHEIKTLRKDNNLISTESPIEKSYPLSPMQRGLLFHYLVNPESESYVVQLLWDLDPSIEIVRLHQAFEYLVARHDILRTAFEWERLAEPLQHVYKESTLIWQNHTWVNYSEKNLEVKLKEFLQADRQLGFKPDKPQGLRINTILLPNGQHKIILTVSHLLLDGWSLSLLFKELEQYYKYLSQSNEILPASVPYQNYITWLVAQNLDKAGDYWKAYFEGVEPTTECPIIKPLKTEDLFISPNHQSEVTEFSAELMVQIEEFCQSRGLTFNSFIQGIWGLILHYYAGCAGGEDVIFGITVSNRSFDLQKTLGLLINTLPLRIRMKNVTITQYFKEVQEQIFDMFNFAYTPLDQIKTWSGITFTSPLFETLVVTENYPKFKSEVLKMDFSDLEIIDPVHYPLTLIAIPGKKLSLKFNYDSNRVNTVNIHRLIGHIQTVLREILTKPYQLIHQLNFLTASEYQSMYAEWKKTKMGTFFANKSVIELFEEQVKETPDRIAGVFQGKQLSFSQLNDNANFLSARLLKRKVKPGDVIAICIDRNLEMLIGQLAIIKTKAVIVMLDIKNSVQRINFIIEDCNPTLILTESAIEEQIAYKFPKEKIIFVDKALKKFRNSTINSRLFCFKQMLRTEIEMPYYVAVDNTLASKALFHVYTSGTTGNPKGVVQSHETIANLVLWQNKKYLGRTLRVAQFASYGFDVCQQEIFFSLLNGHILYFIPEAIKLNPSLLIEYIIGNEINILFLPTALLAIFCQAANQIPNHFLPNLVEVIVAGEELKLYAEILSFFKRNMHIKLTNHYGPSETHVVTSYTLDTAIPELPFKCAIGKPIANTKIYIRDSAGRLLPPLCIGEIWISGPGVALAYWNHPQLTQEKIIQDIYSHNPADRMYCTGDLGYQTIEGNFIYVGRSDDQVKIDGSFVKLSDVITAFEKHPEVAKATVLVQPLQNGIKKLMAYVIRKEGSQIDKEQLRRFLENSFALTVIPNITFLTDFPLIANGKIDKVALLALASHENHSVNYVAAANSPIEIKMEAIWNTILGIKEPISILDNFFQLGGKSLLALQLLGEIKSQFKVEMDLKTLYSHSTIKDLANYIAQINTTKIDISQFNFFEKKKSLFLKQCVIPLHNSGRKTPLFLVHPVGGAIFWFLQLALSKSWDFNRPLYGIQDLGIETLALHFHSVEEMAIAYVHAIRQIQPHGPYLIGGASAGAATSVAMAQVFRRLGEEIAFIGLFDGWAPYPAQLKKNQNLFDVIMRTQYDKWKREFLDKKIESADKLLQLQWARAQQNANYKIPFTDQMLTLFKAKEVSPVYRDINSPDNHWAKYCKHLEIHNVTGGHDTIFEGENVSELAKLVCDCLDRADLKKQFDAQIGKICLAK